MSNDCRSGLLGGALEGRTLTRTQGLTLNAKIDQLQGMLKYKGKHVISSIRLGGLSGIAPCSSF